MAKLQPPGLHLNNQPTEEAEDPKKSGTGWSHDGVRGYQPFVISWSERRRFLAADLLAANNNPVAVSPRLVRRALTLLPRGADGVWLRGDSGFYSADLMAECAKKGVRFSICAKRTMELPIQFDQVRQCWTQKLIVIQALELQPLG